MLTASDIARVMARYDLGASEGLAATGHGFVNETAIVATCRGRFIVRRNHRRFSLPAHSYRHALIDWLRHRGAPTAAVLAARDGATLTMLDGRAYEVQEYVEGGDFDPSRPQQVAAAGAAVACYHQAVRGFPPPAEPSDPRYAPRALNGLVERLLERDAMADLHDALAWYAERAAALSAQLPEAAYRSLPHLLIHGDIHPDNFRFAADRVTALLDFDQVAWDARAADLADALVAFATAPDGAQGWGVFRGPLDEERAARLLGAYAEVSALAPPEAAALPVLLEVLWLRGELGRVLSTPEGAPEYHLEVLDQGRRLSAWVAARAPGMVAAWTALGAAVRSPRAA